MMTIQFDNITISIKNIEKEEQIKNIILKTKENTTKKQQKGKKWNKEEIQFLKDSIEKNIPEEEISKLLRRTVSAILSKKWHLKNKK